MRRSIKLALAFILLLFICLRFIHINHPSIGLHNAKENDYLSEAQSLYRQGLDLERHAHVLNEDGESPQNEYPQIPMLAALIAGIWKLFGVGFWQARVIILLLSLPGILAVYPLAIIFKRMEWTAILAALIFSLIPLVIFYGRNIQPDIPALSFALIGTFLGHILFKNKDWKLPVAYGICWSLCLILKPTTLILLIPSLALLRIPSRKNSWQLVLIIGLIALPTLVFLSASKSSQWNEWHSRSIERIHFLAIFTTGYWQINSHAIWMQIKAGLTTPLLYLSVAGILIGMLGENKKLRSFLILYLLAIIPYAMFLSDYLGKHDYYYAPFTPLVALGAALALEWTYQKSLQVFALRPALAYLAPTLIFVSLLPDLAHFTQSHFNKVFYGLDTIAEYLKVESKPDQKIWVYGDTQAYGFCYNANRYCVPFPKTDEELKRMNLNWLVVYDSPLTFDSPNQREFVEKNFDLKFNGFGPDLDDKGNKIWLYSIFSRPTNSKPDHNDL